jgi:threonyl-tRNA synthetase
MRILIQIDDEEIEVECEAGITPLKLLEECEACSKLKDSVLAAIVDGVPFDLKRPIGSCSRLRFVGFEDEVGRDVYRHTTAHIMAHAVKRLFPEAKLGIGPPIENGFYYDFDVEKPFEPHHLELIEKEMQKLIDADIPIERIEMSRSKARELFATLGEKYKVELIDEMTEETVTVYQQGEFVDLCKGPHLPSTGYVKAFKLLHSAGAYWRGDERNPMLQRIYGTSFPTFEQLQEHLKSLEEAQRRDHRRLGRELGLFSIEEEIGAGLVLWHPNGAIVRQLIEDLLRAELTKRGYKFVYTPHIAKAELWKVSGHLSWYRENMFSGIDVEGQEYLVRPMNCPFHILIYKSATRSYRDLPMRLAEMGTVYRYERSGTLHGLMRVRGLTQDDAHIFCTLEQVGDEIEALIDLTYYFLKQFGFEQFDVVLSVRDKIHPEKYAGRDEIWELAEAELEGVLKKLGIKYKRLEGEANFYGPKIDVYLFDAIGRKWQCTTIQLDFNLPERFQLTYIGSDGKEHRPVMIHRAILGSMERFIGILIEHYAGAFPVWLAPVQVSIVPVADRHLDYANRVAEELSRLNIRVEVISRSEPVAAKIRDCELRKVPYIIVCGDREANSNCVSVRQRGRKELGSMSVEQFKTMLLNQIESRGV